MARKHDPVLEEFVREFVEAFLRGIPNTAEFQDQYGELSPALKARITKETTQIAERMTKRLLEYKDPGGVPPKTLARLLRESIEDD